MPPGRFSTTTGCPQRLCSSSPSARIKMSLIPPALVVVRALIGRDGYSCARDGVVAVAMAINAAIAAKRFMLSRSRCLSLWQQACVFDDAPGLDPILPEELRELLGRVEHGLEPARDQVFVAEGCLVRDRPDIGGNLRDEGRRHAHPRVEAEIGPPQP